MSDPMIGNKKWEHMFDEVFANSSRRQEVADNLKSAVGAMAAFERELKKSSADYTHHDKDRLNDLKTLPDNNSRAVKDWLVRQLESSQVSTLRLMFDYEDPINRPKDAPNKVTFTTVGNVSEQLVLDLATGKIL